MIIEMISLFYFFLPAAFANMAPVLGKNILKPLAKPIDFGKKWNKKPILGSHKTWRGLILASLTGIIIILIQKYIYNLGYLRSISIIDYSSFNNLILLGLLLGFGAIFGDMVKSFFKRRVNVKSGEPWIPFDQIDYSIGGVVFTKFIYPLTLLQAIIIIITYAILHIAANHIGYYLKIREVKW